MTEDEDEGYEDEDEGEEDELQCVDPCIPSEWGGLGKIQIEGINMWFNQHICGALNLKI